MALANDITKSMEISRSFLSFKLENEYFGVNVMKVLEILEVPTITKVPNAPAYMVGVVNLRGGVLPVIDTRVKFGMSPTSFHINTCILVLNIQMEEETIVVGALVDAVDEVFETEEVQVQPSPSIGSKYRPDFIHGMIQIKDQFMMLLNIDKVFSADDIESIRESQEEASLDLENN